MNNSKEFALIAARAIDNKKGRDILVLDIGSKSSFADYFVIATGGTERQIAALMDEVEDKLAKEGLFSKNVEGKQGSGWILMDFGDLVVNLFTEEQRGRYNLEKIWNDCESVDWEVQ